MAIFTIGAQAMEIVLPVWLSVWSQAYAGGQPNPNLGIFIGIFTGIFTAIKANLRQHLKLIGTRAWFCAGVIVGHLTPTPIFRFLESQ